MGHPAPWDYSPRQLKAFLFIAGKRRTRQMADDLALHAMANSGDGKAIKDQLKKWHKDLG